MAKTLKDSHSTSKRQKCLIWTRVSSNEQEHSLQMQVDACKKLAEDLGFKEIDYYPSVSESAKEAGEHFKKMLKKVKDKRNGYDGVIVEYVDRLSRNTPIGTGEIRKLFQKGIYVYSSFEGLNTENEQDIFRADVYFSSAEKDNRIRTQKTKNGTIHWLKKGYHMGKTPVGYKRRTEFPKTDERSKEIVPNEDAPFIAEGFRLYNNGVSIKKIEETICLQGFDLSEKRWGVILRNPIYKGIIKNKALNGEVVIGKHEPIVSKITFDNVQKRLSKNFKTKSTDEVDEIVLKGKIKCCNCGNQLTAYEKRKKDKTYHYYKCFNKGCKVNISAKKVYNGFKEELSKLQLDSNFSDYISEVTSEMYDETYHYESVKNAKLKEKITKLNNRISKIEDDYYDGDVSKKKMDEKVKQWESEKSALQSEVTNSSVVDKEDFISQIISDLSEFENLFNSLPFDIKQQASNLLYDSITYEKSNDELHTSEPIQLFTVA